MRRVQVPLLIFFLSFASIAQSEKWKLNSLQKIGGHRTEIVGAPRVSGGVVEFDGVDDGIFLDTNPVEGFSAFTVEAVFRPDAGGNREQRWLHIQQTDADNRVLLEIRVVGNEWFLDTFMKSGENRLTHYAEKFMHPLGKWFHVALVFDGKQMRHYVNGNVEAEGNMTITPFGKGRTSLGVRQNKVHWFKGAISVIRVTGKALEPKDFKYQKAHRTSKSR